MDKVDRYLARIRDAVVLTTKLPDDEYSVHVHLGELARIACDAYKIVQMDPDDEQIRNVTDWAVCALEEAVSHALDVQAMQEIMGS